MDERIDMSSNEEYILTYFNWRGGGEIVRLVFAAAGVAYTDNRIEKTEWIKLKPEMPMKNVPVLTVKHNNSSMTYCQSGAISRYIARKYGLHGATDEEQFLIEEVYDSVGDVRGYFVQWHFSTDTKVKEQLLEKLKTTAIPNLNDYLVKRKSVYGSDNFIVGEKLTLADLALFNLVDGCIQMGLGSMFESYTVMLNHREAVLQTPRINNWVNSRPKTQV